MKTLFTFLMIFMLSTGLFAQKFIREWYVQVPAITAEGEATAIMTTPDNKLLIAGPALTADNNGTMFYLKADTAGNAIWLSYTEEQFNAKYQHANHLMTDVDNNFVMIGNYPLGSSTGTYFTKVSSSGEMLDATTNGAQYDYQGGYDVEQTVDSGFLVTAFKDVYGVHACLALRKLDNTGHFIWDTLFAANADTNFIPGAFSGMDKVDDSTFVLTGKRRYRKEVGGDDLDILFAKIRVYDDSVRFLNYTVYEGEYNDYGNDILTLPDNQGYLICGTGPNENNPGSTQGIILQTDTAGNIVWRETFARSMSSNTGFIKIHLNNDNDIDVLAFANDNYNSGDPALLKYSPDGDLLQKTYFDYGGIETIYDFTLDQDGKIYIATSNMVQGHGFPLLLKVKDICPVSTPEAALNDTILQPGEDVITHVLNTNVAWSYSLIQINGEITLGTYMGNGSTLDFTTSGLTNEDVAEGLVVSVVEPDVDCIKYSDTLHMVFYDGIEDVYSKTLVIAPNPAHNLITISDNTYKLSGTTLYNTNGQLIMNELNTAQQLNLTGLAKGMYYLKISYENGDFVFRKIIKY